MADDTNEGASNISQGLYKHFSADEKRIIFKYLLKNSENMKVKKGFKSIAAVKFSVSTRTVTRIWSLGKQQIGDGIDFSCKSFGNKRRKRIHIDVNMVKEVPFNRRTNIRSLASAINVSKSMVHRRIQDDGFMRPHTNAIKPLLTEANKKARLRFCLSMITYDINLNISLFSSMMGHIHFDEKWFTMTKKAQRYYLLPDETPPHRSCKSTNFIDKIMFLCVVARPRFDPIRNTMFKGKIGIFPFVTKEPAKRKSTNRLAGTLETKVINPITKDVSRRMLIDKVVPAIQSMWPGGNTSGTITVQQDNAKPHINFNDKEFVEATTSNGFDIRLYFQPPNSPDLNVLDLGFFRAIQTLQHEQAPTSIDELVAAVEKSFEELHHDKLNKMFLKLQLNMIAIMKAGGGNNFKQPHFDDNQCPSGTIPL